MGELARQKYGGPQLPKTPLELITPRPGEGFSFYDKWNWAITGAVSYFMSVVAFNYDARRPWWSSMRRNLIYSGLAAMTCHWLGEWKRNAQIEADATIKHYISLHPEDFPPFERKRWGEIYQAFKPVR